MNEQIVVWTRQRGIGLEYCAITLNPVVLGGEVIAQLDEGPVLVTYEVSCDESGRTRDVQVACRYAGRMEQLTLHCGQSLRWWLHGKELREFRGVADVDLGITPSTNILPIRRLNLQPGEAAHLTALWVRFPQLTLARLDQQYTRLTDKTYRYRSSNGYESLLDVDEESVVISYQGEWTRVS